MKKIIFIILLLFPSTSFASLHFVDSSTDKVAITATTSLNTLAAGTVIIWINPDNVNNSVRGIISKADDNLGNAGWSVNKRGGNGGNWLFKLVGTITSLAVDTGNNKMTAGSWQLLSYAWTFGSSAKAYRGTATSSAIDVSNAASNGTGTQVSDNSFNLEIGNRGTAPGSQPGNIAFVGIWNRQLTQLEIIGQQWHPHVTSGNVLFMWLGFNGTATQPDWSGKRNSGTVAGATVAPNVPLGRLF